jgi:DNA-binding helix-hairpin-helix protein with protein kinase domain
MTSPTMYVDGESVRLGKRIGRGGEGEVFALENDLNRVLKIYTSTADTQQREAKITSIVNRKIGAQSSLVAFPLAIARRIDGKFAGFVMKRVDGHKPLFELYSPGARKKNFPRADFRFLVRTAANVSRAVASVHKTGCVIGDINHSGILVSDEAKVALIDADSFQIIDGADKFLCRVGVPEYTPPELQGKKLSNVMRTANHDAFGLAVVIFQLLFMGRHPFVGAFAKGDMPMERAIFENRFVYSLIRDVGMTRPPGAASLADFPQYVAEAFEQAFSPNAERRPTAEAWINILVRLESAIVQCASDNLHYYPQAAAECPWCRMENKLGILLFLPNFLSRGAATFDPGAASFDLAAAWAAIEKVILPSPSQLQPVVPAVDYVPSPEAKKAKVQVWKSKMIGFATLLLTGAIAFAWPRGWFLWSAGIIFACVKLFRIKIESEQEFVDKYLKSMQRFKESTEAWRTRCGITQAIEVKNALLEAKRQLNKSEREKALRLSVYQNKRRGLQMLNFLESQEIRKAKIRHVGLARQTALASYGIENALDITEEKVLQVPGFGANNSLPLLEWRRHVEKSFVYDPKPNEMDKEELQKVQFEIDQSGSQFRRILTSGPSDLTRAVHAISVREKKVDPQIARAFAELRRAKEDLIYLGIPIPKKTMTPDSKGGAGSRTTAGAAVGSRGGAPAGSRSGAVARAASRAASRSLPNQNLTAQHSKAGKHTGPTRCPKCGQGMLKRVVRHGSHAGKEFYGCSTYPVCDGVT